MPTTEVDGRLVAPRPEEADQIRSLNSRLGEEKAGRYFLYAEEGEKIAIPPSVFQVLVRAVRELSQGRSVQILHYGHELTTQEAADILNVSRPFLIKLLEEGSIPHHKVGTHRRIKMGDLMAFKEKRDEDRHRQLQDLRNASKSLGLYGKD